jgi:hypothetical protein
LQYHTLALVRGVQHRRFPLLARSALAFDHF